MPGYDGYCWGHWVTKQPVVDAPEPLTKLPKLPTDTDLIERLRRWAREFDTLDVPPVPAVDFLEWVELELAAR